jgi:4-amino-4-deoxy-L-arabinose transferase-like glycosyltransferase
MNKKFVWIIFTVIIIIAAFLRIWQLGAVPPSPDWDEVALGYDAYSIIHTGKDEFGKFLPVVLRSFDDYKPALYAYFAIPSVLAFDLSVFAVRFPSALFGIISAVSLFFLIRELFEKYKYRDYLALLSSFFLAISPWSIQFSRVAFESNVGDSLNILTVLFFIKGLKRPWLFSLSAIFAGLAIYVYQSEKVFTPLIVFALLFIYFGKIKKINKKYIITAIITGIIVILPMAYYILTDSGSLLRVKGTSIFSYQTELLKTNTQKLETDKENNDKLGLLLDNRRIVYAKTIVDGYVSHFDPNWLFITGDIARHHAPNMGLLYLFEFPFILFGIYLLVFGDFDKKTKFLILSWFLLAPIPASITTGVPHAVRTLNFLPTFQIFSALGVIVFVEYVLKFKRIRIPILSILLILFLFNFSYFLNQYFVQQNYYHSQDWQYGYEQAVTEVKKLEGNYKEIVISDKQPLDKSYMFFLFYTKYSPAEYQKIGVNSSGGFDSHHSFGRYTFRQINWKEDSNKKDILFVGNPGEIPDGVNTLKIIRNLDGSEAIRIVGFD